jgi:DHA1 family bicyclomycin/chloramphenicol resistance-like MFS transporter
MMVFIVVPVIAPSVGSVALLFGSWHLIFAGLCVIAVVAIAWTGLRLPETRPPEARDPLSFSWLSGAFREVIGNRLTLGYTLATGAVFGALMGYVNSAQQVFVDVYGLGAMFPVVFGLVALAIALASFFNSRFVMRLGMRRISHAALLGFAGTALVHLAIAAAVGRPPLAVFVVMLALSLLCFGLMMPNFNAIAMEPMGRIAGTASSFIGCATTAVGAVLGLYIGQWFDGTVVPLVAGFAVCGCLGLALVLVTERGRLFRDGAQGARRS